MYHFANCYYFQVSLTQARIDMSELDEDSDGFLQPHVWTSQHMLKDFIP